MVSALFSTYNRAALLEKALEGLASQTLPRDNFEVIVVDDGSSDDTRHVVEKFNGVLSLKYVFQENQGLAVGKNEAIKLADAPIVLFMDDDDVSHPRLLEEHLRTHSSYSGDYYAVLGYTSIDEDILKYPLMQFVTLDGCYLFCYPRIKHGDVLDYTYFWGGRSSCKRNYLLENGLFNPVFRFGCEDIELGYRLSKFNLKVVYNENAVSTMIRRVTLDEFCRRVERQGRSNWTFSQLHPVEEILSWCMVGSLDADWESFGRYYDVSMKCARDLDVIANARLENHCASDAILQRLLYRSYREVINAYRVKGSYEAKLTS